MRSILKTSLNDAHDIGDASTLDQVREKKQAKSNTHVEVSHTGETVYVQTIKTGAWVIIFSPYNYVLEFLRSNLHVWLVLLLFFKTAVNNISFLGKLKRVYKNHSENKNATLHTTCNVHVLCTYNLRLTELQIKKNFFFNTF